MQIAIDGPSGSGKSTVARVLAQRLGIMYLDSGALYRAVGLRALNLGVDLDDEAAILAIMDDVEFDLVGENVALRTAEAGTAASAVGRHYAVRAKVVKFIQDFVSGKSIVMDGRDIGTVVLPCADVKIFLTASVEARALRRCYELAALLGEPVDFNDIAAQIAARDEQDMGRDASPLKMAYDAHYIDSSHMDIEETVAAILKIINPAKEATVPQANVLIKIDEEVKNQAEELFAKLGMTLSTAANIFYRQAIKVQGIPFAITVGETDDNEMGCLKT